MFKVDIYRKNRTSIKLGVLFCLLRYLTNVPGSYLERLTQ